MMAQAQQRGWQGHETVRQRLARLWASGRLLRCRLDPDETFPLRIPLKHPTARELGERFDIARDWVRQVQQASERHGYALEWKRIRHRQLGENRLPVAALIADDALALKILGRRREAAQFDGLARKVLDTFPELRGWLLRKPLRILEYADHWPQLLAILQWLRDHPRPGIYLRQIDLPGVHTKYIEAHRGLLAELLDIVLPADAIDAEATGAKNFERRYGFRSKPVLIRFRLLDPAQAIAGLTDLTIPLADFARLEPPAQRVFVTENDINGLAFPEQADALVIFGLGYGVDALAEVPWLSGRALYYWGDIDTHGFAMLDRLRHHLPHARSLLMDEDILLAHRTLWGQEPKPIRHALPRLHGDEAALYDKLRHDELGERLRLEQERIGFHQLEQALSRQA